MSSIKKIALVPAENHNIDLKNVIFFNTAYTEIYFIDVAGKYQKFQYKKK